MKTERQPEPPLPSDDETNPDKAGIRSASRRVAYKTVLAALVIGSLMTSALWMFVTRQEGKPANAMRVTAPDIQANEDTEAKGPQVAPTEDEYGAIDRRLAALSGRIEQGLAVQQTHGSVVKRELKALAEGTRTIKAAIVELGESHKELARRINEAIARLDTLAKEVRALKVVKRKPAAKHKARPVQAPPFRIDAIDSWDDVTYVAVSRAGRAAFLKAGEQQSGWTVTHIDRRKGQVDFQGPGGQVHSVSLPR